MSWPSMAGFSNRWLLARCGERRAADMAGADAPHFDRVSSPEKFAEKPVRRLWLWGVECEEHE